MPYFPVLRPLNKIGPGELNFTKIETTKNKGKKAIMPIEEKNISNSLLAIKYV
jgi:hypothetical protein